MSNNWGFVFAAYAIAALILVGYWWRVERRLRTLEPLGDSPGGARK
jgi:hypothetical protein